MTDDNKKDTQKLGKDFTSTGFESVDYEDALQPRSLKPTTFSEEFTETSIDFNPLESVENMPQIDLSEEQKKALQVSSENVTPVYLIEPD